MSAPPARHEPPSRLGLALLLGVTLAWGSNWPIIKVLLQELPPLTLRGLTCPTAALILLGLAKLSGHSLRVPRDKWPAFFWSTLLNITFWYVGSTYSLLYLPAGKAVLIAYTMPVWTALLTVVVLKEPLSARVALALALGLGGIAALVGGDVRALGEAPIGIAFVLTAAVAWAIGTILFKRVVWNCSMVALSGWQLLIGTLPLTLAAPFVDLHALVWPSPGTMLGIAYNVFIALAFGNYGWFKLVSLLPVSVSSIGTLMLPVVGVAGSTLFLGEAFGWREAGALVLVGSALGLVLFQPRARSRA